MRASESERLIACPWSLVAPRTLVRRKKSNDAAGYGSLVHHWKETGDVPEHGEWSAADVVLLQKKLLLSGADRGVLWCGGEHEVSFSLNLVTEECITAVGPREGCEAWKASFDARRYLTGTIDYIDESRSWVDDLKTGRWPVEAKGNKQLLSYALPMWLARGKPPNDAITLSITRWPKYTLAAPPVRSIWTATGFDLAEHLEALRHTAAHTDVARIGEQCTFCDAREPIPMTPHMQHYQHRAMPACARGLVSAAHNITEDQ